MFLIFKSDAQISIFYYYFRIDFSKIKNDKLENSKYFKFLYPIKFSYEKFNEYDRLKFKNDLIYFFS
jgi:hypothetical protein